MKNALLLAFVLPVSQVRTKILFTQRLILILIVFASCTRQEKQPVSLTPIQTNSKDMIALAGDMFQKFKDSLDLAHVTMIHGRQNVKIYMAKFKNNTNRIYAVSSLGDEVMYVGMMQDSRNGRMAILKEGEAVLITVKDGITEIKDLDRKQWSYYFTTQYHGGKGFCQRMPGETFSTCYEAEADEFCDSFISCIAVDTQPIVVIVIAAACSCKAEPPVITEHHWWDTVQTNTDSFLRLNKDSLLQLPLDTLP